MYETLIYLVTIHAQINSAAEGLLDRILSYLVLELAEEALRCFRQVRRFGMGGMLRVSTLMNATPCSKLMGLHRYVGNSRDRVHASDPREVHIGGQPYIGGAVQQDIPVVCASAG